MVVVDWTGLPTPALTRPWAARFLFSFSTQATVPPVTRFELAKKANA